jgi:hypothetical protein
VLAWNQVVILPKGRDAATLKFSAEVLDAALAAAHDSRQGIELLIEHDDEFRTLHVEYFDGARFPHLIRIDERPDTLTQVLAARGG